MILEYHNCVLDNGLRIIQESSPTDIVYCGLFVDAGTRDEDGKDSGLAHFCEHTSFKGTTTRKSWQIRNCLESVGGDLNAYTNKEETVYYATVRKDDFDRAAQLLFDIVFHSIYPSKELEKETEVIIDEIDSYNDSPAELIYDEFEEMLFKGHGLGRNILGNAVRLRSYSTSDALRFTQKYYVPSNVTFFIYGNVKFDHICKLADKSTRDLSMKKVDKTVQQLPTYIPEKRICEHHTHQAHVLIGNRVYSNHDPRHIALSLLSNLLGGPGMNSLLNVALRENHGLVYTAESTVFYYTDAGVWSIYFGCDEENVPLCTRLILHILKRLTDKPLSERQLSKAKKQFIGQLQIANDNFENYALALGKTYARTGKHRNIDDLCLKIQSLTPQTIYDVTCDIFQDDKLTTLQYK